MITTFVLLWIGATRHCFNFSFGGLAGVLLGDKKNVRANRHFLWALPFGRVHRIRIRLASFSSRPPICSTRPSCPSHVWLYFFFLLCFPLTLKSQKNLFALAEILNAWSGVEVFIIPIVAALLEISAFSDFIVGDKCNLINQVLQENFDKELEGDDTCFSVHSSVGASAWTLILGVLLNSFLVSVMLRFLHCAVAERQERTVPENSERLQHDRLENSEENDNDSCAAATFVDHLLESMVGALLYVQVFKGSSDALNAWGNDGLRSEQSQPNKTLWEEWRRVCSWT